VDVPDWVEQARRAAAAAGFSLSCEPGVGRLLSVLAAAVPRCGTILELGTGAGVGLAWIVAGLGARTDVRVVSVELDPEVASVAARQGWPDFVQVETGDGLDVLRRSDRWDLIFADAPGGKWYGLDDTIDALGPGGVLLVDDMTPPEFADDLHRTKTIEVRQRLLTDDRLFVVEIGWSSGVILCARRPPGDSRSSRD
jgi:demethylmenaquinone methyltransferase/2-methoxy-6-polyprenyl-1,4-benzoquinol methylase